VGNLDRTTGYNFFDRMVLMMFSDATMANLQDDSPDLHIADAPRARAIGIRASARIIDPSRKEPRSRLFPTPGLCPPLTSAMADDRVIALSVDDLRAGENREVLIVGQLGRHLICSVGSKVRRSHWKRPFDNREVYDTCSISRGRFYITICVYELYQRTLSWLFQSSLPHHKSTQCFVYCDLQHAKASVAP
jgi:hypothetical protein